MLLLLLLSARGSCVRKGFERANPGVARSGNKACRNESKSICESSAEGGGCSTCPSSSVEGLDEEDEVDEPENEEMDEEEEEEEDDDESTMSAA